MNQEPQVDKFPCAVCKKLSNSQCSRCFKIAYCGVEHQKEDWKNHKPFCLPFPVKLKASCGECPLKSLVARKDIVKGQIIFKERSLVSGPYGLPYYTAANRLRPPILTKVVCLSCYKEIPSQAMYTCSKCHWPVCNEECEKEEVHAEAECKIFSERNVKRLTLTEEVNNYGRNIYTMITILRAILLRHQDPNKWQKILNNYSYPLLAGLNLKQVSDSVVIDFIQNTCGLSEIDKNIIARVASIIAYNTRGNNVTEHWASEPICPRTASYLFHDLSYICRDPETFNCVIQYDQITKSEIEVTVIAIRSIPVGEHIKHIYENFDTLKVKANPWYGWLKEHNYLLWEAALQIRDLNYIPPRRTNEENNTEENGNGTEEKLN